MPDNPRARLQRQVARARAREAAARAEAEGVEEVLRRMGSTIGAMNEALAALVERRGLTPAYPTGTLGTDHMEAQSPSAGANISAAKTKSRWPMQRALIKRNLSLPEWARAQRKPAIEVETAKSWMKKPSKGGRKIPRFWADRIATEFVDDAGTTEVPAVAASWPSGIRED